MNRIVPIRHRPCAESNPCPAPWQDLCTGANLPRLERGLILALVHVVVAVPDAAAADAARGRQQAAAEGQQQQQPSATAPPPQKHLSADWALNRAHQLQQLDLLEADDEVVTLIQALQGGDAGAQAVQVLRQRPTPAAFATRDQPLPPLPDAAGSSGLPLLCCNPTCTIMLSRGCELQARPGQGGDGPLGALLTCARCNRSVYCGKECQVQHWRWWGHREECGRE
jgi:hypothetical protein